MDKLGIGDEAGIRDVEGLIDVAWSLGRAVGETDSVGIVVGSLEKSSVGISEKKAEGN